jgi:hypothetical protein
VVSYAQRTAGVTVTLDSSADDGEAGEHDDVSGVEDVYGSTYTDLLVGDDGPNRLDGSFGGADVILGQGGADVIEATSPYAERVAGGPGSDHVVAGSSARVELRDGEPDELTCGLLGVASLDADPFDRTVGCTYAHLRFAQVARIDTSRDRRVQVRADCFASPGRKCDGAVRLLIANTSTVLASGPFHLQRGQTARIKLKLRATGRKLQRKRRRVFVQVLAVHQVPNDPTSLPDVDSLYTTWMTRP